MTAVQGQTEEHQQVKRQRTTIDQKAAEETQRAAEKRRENQVGNGGAVLSGLRQQEANEAPWRDPMATFGGKRRLGGSGAPVETRQHSGGTGAKALMVGKAKGGGGVETGPFKKKRKRRRRPGRREGLGWRRNRLNRTRIHDFKQIVAIPKKGREIRKIVSLID